MPKLADCLRVRLDKETQAERLEVIPDAEIRKIPGLKPITIPMIKAPGNGRQGTKEKARPPL